MVLDELLCDVDSSDTLAGIIILRAVCTISNSYVIVYRTNLTSLQWL